MNEKDRKFLEHARMASKMRDGDQIHAAHLEHLCAIIDGLEAEVKEAVRAENKRCAEIARNGAIEIPWTGNETKYDTQHRKGVRNGIYAAIVNSFEALTKGASHG